MIRDSVRISDWISFLLEEISTLKETLLFIATNILAVIIVIGIIPITNNPMETGVIRLIIMVFLWIVFMMYHKKLKKAKEPYRELLLKIMRKDITKTRDIMMEYNNIKNNEME
jgi:uncharacterized BrkB/YihY/UPF0761 family membrane protein